MELGAITGTTVTYLNNDSYRFFVDTNGNIYLLIQGIIVFRNGLPEQSGPPLPENGLGIKANQLNNPQEFL
jgi:hypothetical protein